MKRTLVLLSIGSSLMVAACASPHQGDLGFACLWRPIAVSEATRAHLRAPLSADVPLPDGYERFLRDLAAHNAKAVALCPSGHRA